MSLRTRLLIVVAAVLITYVAAAFVIVSAQRSLLIEQVDRRLQALPLVALSATGRPVPNPTARADASAGSDGVQSPFSPFYVGAITADGTVTTIADAGLPSPPDISAAVAEVGSATKIVTVNATSGSPRFRALVVPQSTTGPWIVTAQSLAETDAAVSRLIGTLVIAGAVIGIVLGVAVFWVQRLGLRPIARVTAAAAAISAGDRAHRVAVDSPTTEAGKLALAFNLMLDERDRSESRLRQFVADASHELRTPLTSVRGYLELYRQGAFTESHQMDDVVRRLSAEAARMNGLVEDLLALASLDEGRPLASDAVDLGQLLRDAAQDAQAVQPERSIAVTAPGSGPVVHGDHALLVQLVGILVSNALAHTPVETSISLYARGETGWAVVIVADSGPGLDAEAAAHAFDRFWRGQGSRSRGQRSGGAGLGLSIARAITDAHGGGIALTTAPGDGCTFTIQLPYQRPPETGAAQ